MVDQRMSKWQTWLPRIASDVDLALTHRAVWERTWSVAAANPTLPESYWWQFLVEVYGASQASAVRRLADAHREAVSLRRVMSEVRDEAPRLTVAMFVGTLERIGLDDRVRQIGTEWWRETFSDGVSDHVSAAVVESDLARLEAASGRVVTYVDKFVAHTERREPPLPTLGDLHGAIDVAVELFQRYYRLIIGGYWPEPVLPSEWDHVFDVPWSSEPRP
jgi:hypothetical protein